jgi:hypothetical protein
LENVFFLVNLSIINLRSYFCHLLLKSDALW